MGITTAGIINSKGMSMRTTVINCNCVGMRATACCICVVHIATYSRATINRCCCIIFGFFINSVCMTASAITTSTMGVTSTTSN